MLSSTYIHCENINISRALIFVDSVGMKFFTHCSLTVQCSVTSRDGDDSLSSVQGTEHNPLEHGASTSGVTGDQAVKER